MFSNSNAWVNYAFVGISGFGFSANFKGLKYITQTFNVSDNLFNMLAVDSMITTILNGLYSVGSLIMIVNRDILKTSFACGSLILIGFLPMVTGTILNLIDTYLVAFLNHMTICLLYDFSTEIHRSQASGSAEKGFLRGSNATNNK